MAKKSLQFLMRGLALALALSWSGSSPLLAQVGYSETSERVGKAFKEVVNELSRDQREEERRRVASSLLTVGVLILVARAVYPGPLSFRFLPLVAHVFSDRKIRTVIEPVIRDLQEEHAEALESGSIWRAQYVRLRGDYAFCCAVVAQGRSSLYNHLLKAIRWS